MKGLYRLNILFTIALVGLGWFLYPRTKELIYVFERSKNYVELERLYTIRQNENFDEEREKKLLLVKIELRRKGADKYAMGYLQKSFDGNYFSALMTKFERKHVYASQAELLEIGYEVTRDTKYLILQKNLYSFLGWSTKLIKVLRQLYEDTLTTSILNDLFGLKDKQYAIDQLYKRRKTLALDDLFMLRNFLSWTGQIKIAYQITKEFITVERLNKSDREMHLNRAIYYSDDLQVIKIYTMKYREAEKLEDLMKKAYYQEYYGFVEDSLSTYELIYRINPDLEILDRLVSNSRYINYVEVYRKYRFLFALLSNDYSLFNEDINQLLQESKFKLAIKRCDAFINSLLERIKTEPSQDNLYHLNQSYQLLYVSLHESGQIETLLNLLKSKPKAMLTPTELAYICDLQEINRQNIEYFVLYYTRSKFEYIQDLVMNYTLKNDPTPTSYKLYGQFRGKMSWTNLYDYFKYYKDYPKKYKTELIRLIDIEKEPKLLVLIAQRLQELTQMTLAKKAFQKALVISPYSKVALKQLGLLFYNSGDLQRAKFYFERYYSVDKKDLLVNFNLADTLDSNSSLKPKLYQSIIELADMTKYDDKVLALRSKARLKLTEEAYELYVSMINQYGRKHEIFVDYLDFLLSNRRYEDLKNEVELMDIPALKNQRIIQIVGAHYSYIKDYKQALDLYLKAESILDKKDLKDSYLYSDIAYVYELIGVEKQALIYYRKSLKLRNDLLLQEVAFQLETKISDTVELSYNVRNDVTEKRLQLKNRNGDFEMKFNYSKVEQQTQYYLEVFHDKRLPIGAVLGNLDYNIYAGNKLQLKLGTRYYKDTLIGAQEKAQTSYSTLLYNFQLGQTNYQALYQRNHFKNPFGNIGSTSGYSLTASKSIGKNYTLSGGYSNEKVNSFTPINSNVFLDDFKSLFGQYRFDRRGHVKFKYYAFLGVSYRFGGINPSLGFGFRWNRNWYFDYEVFQDRFTNQNINSFQFRYLKMI
ncbi:MAG: hypothetical protein KC646_04950 [Candidatus Cloacimonetes bacterium]|nr:hypothetical protein [Candidatus Cloacimonadota bacterium]